MGSADQEGEKAKVKTTLVVGFLALLFGAIVIWPAAETRISRGIGGSTDRFLSTDRIHAEDEETLVTSAGEATSVGLESTDGTLVTSSNDEDSATTSTTVEVQDDDNDQDSTTALQTGDAPPVAAPFNDAPSNDPQSPSVSQAEPPSTTAPPQTSTTPTRPPLGSSPPTIPRPTTTSTTTTSTTTTTLLSRPPISLPGALGSFYVDPTSTAANWVNANPNHPSVALIDELIASKPIAAWFGNWNANVENDVRTYVNAAHAENKIPVLVAYNIPNRDCGQFSAGGAQGHSAYATWIHDFADGLGTGRSIVILEPDSLAFTDCLDDARTTSLSNAVGLINDHCALCDVYLDAGNSQWIAADEMASRLIDAGVYETDGIVTNVSSYNASANEVAFGQQVLSALGNPAGMGQIIDSSRNGNGSSDPADWCDQQSSALGRRPGIAAKSAQVDAYLWIKVPGEADGCVAPAGVFVPEEAIRLATN